MDDRIVRLRVKDGNHIKMMKYEAAKRLADAAPAQYEILAPPQIEKIEIPKVEKKSVAVSEPENKVIDVKPETLVAEASIEQAVTEQKQRGRPKKL